MTAPALLIEYRAEPLRGGRAQLHVAVFVDGQQQLDLCHPVGSPAPAEAVRPWERTIVRGAV